MTESPAPPLPPHVLVVDDDGRLRDLLRKYLSDNGFVVSVAADAAEARAHMAGMAFDLLIVDVMMPGEDGLALTRSVREFSDVPILMLTARGEADDRIAGFENGVDDYLPKPFEPRELLWRLRAILRRAPQPDAEGPPREITLGSHVFDIGRKELRRDGERVHLTQAETELLVALASRPGDLLTREELAEAAGTAGGARAVDVQVTRLRKKIEPDPRQPHFLHTVRGKGYVLRPD